MKEVIKGAVILALYLGAAPALGSFLARNRVWERAVLALMMFMPSWYPNKLTLMLGSVEWYRGHTKGFEYSHFDVLGLALIIAARIRNPPGTRLMPPGGWIYLSYCLLASLSALTAYNQLFVLMAAWKFTKASVIFIGFYHGFRDLKDLEWVQRSLAFTLFFQGLVGLKMRFLDGMWQVKGWFEHQNPMAMWAYLCAIPCLACAFAHRSKARDTTLYLAGVAGAALLILLSVSRAALAAFAGGASGVVAFAWLRGFKVKTAGLTVVGALGAALAGLLALDSLMARMEEVDSRDESEDLRDILNRQSRAMLDDSPLLGIGWNNFGVANSLPVQKYSQILMDWDEERGFAIYDDNSLANPLTESLYWLHLSETGYLGFGSFVLFELATLWWAARATFRFWKSPTGWFVSALAIGLVITYLHGLVERVLTQTKNLSCWLIFAAMLARVETCRRAGHDLPEPPPNP
jgi:hypothetical protein